MAGEESNRQAGQPETQRQSQEYDQQQQRPQQSGTGQRIAVPLIADEELIVDARPAWSAYFKYFVTAGILLLVGIAQGTGGAVGGIIIAGIIIGYVVYLRQRTRYVVTDRRMMVVRGIASKATNEAWMTDIVGLQTGASILERLLGHGHVTVSSEIRPWIGGMTFGGIDNHTEIAQVVREHQNEEKT